MEEVTWRNVIDRNTNNRCNTKSWRFCYPEKFIEIDMLIYGERVSV